MIGEVQDKNWERKIENEVRQINNFTYLGALPLEEVNNILSTSHIFINTSSAEGFPNSFIQAWLRKVVVVSLDIDPDEVIKHNEIGYVSGNFEQLVQDIQYLIIHPEQRMEMAEKGYQYAMQHHTFSNIAALTAFFHTQPSLYVH
jgi:glycosyltransferase involved in cell wall biosynthesis